MKLFHKGKDESKGTTWVFSIRGPWADVWEEFHPLNNHMVKLTHGRKEFK